MSRGRDINTVINNDVLAKEADEFEEFEDVSHGLEYAADSNYSSSDED